jgi:hypothetical protein
VLPLAFVFRCHFDDVGGVLTKKFHARVKSIFIKVVCALLRLAELDAGLECVSVAIVQVCTLSASRTQCPMQVVPSCRRLNVRSFSCWHRSPLAARAVLISTRMVPSSAALKPMTLSRLAAWTHMGLLHLVDWSCPSGPILTVQVTWVLVRPASLLPSRAPSVMTKNEFRDFDVFVH